MVQDAIVILGKIEMNKEELEIAKKIAEVEGLNIMKNGLFEDLLASANEMVAIETRDVIPERKICIHIIR